MKIANEPLHNCSFAFKLTKLSKVTASSKIVNNSNLGMSACEEFNYTLNGMQ